MQRATVLATAVLALGMLGAPAATAVTPAAVPDQGAASLDRIDGATRYDTAARTALRAHPDGADTVIVATGLNFPDALAASYLSGGDTDAPILLVETDRIPDETRDAMDELAPSKVIVLGRRNAVSRDVVDELGQMVGTDNVRVIGGATRIETAARVARAGGAVGTAADLADPAAGDELRTAIVARSDAFPDALAAGPLALAGRHPILLTPTGTLDATTRDALTDLGIEQVIIAGGEVAISADVEAAIADVDGIVGVHRVQGENRTATAVALAELTRETLGWDGSTVALARGDSFPDALSLAPLAVQQQASLVLAQNPQTLGGDTFAGIQDLCASTDDLLVTGGPVAITPNAAGEAKLATICADHAFPISGDQEVAGGDEDATGTGWVVVEGDTVCVTYDVEGLGGVADMSHLHSGDAGSAGEPVIDLGAPDVDGFRSTCTGNADVAAGIEADPTAYYVNIHTPDLPQGAARGQLAADHTFHVYGAAENDDDPATADADPDVAFGQGVDGLRGDARLFVGDDDTTVCVDLGLPEGTGDLVGAHVHQGRVDENGPVLITFDALEGQPDGWACATPDDAATAAATVAAITADPEAYYLNVHTDAFPGGAARGQLAADATTTLSGEAEVADGQTGAGDPDATGTAAAYRASAANPDVVCASFHVDGLDPLTAAHIHQGEAGTNGDVVVAIGDYGAAGVDAPGADITHDFGCQTDVDPTVTANLFGSPSEFYVNVHSEAFPAGAVRGQLAQG